MNKKRLIYFGKSLALACAILIGFFPSLLTFIAIFILPLFFVSVIGVFIPQKIENIRWLKFYTDLGALISGAVIIYFGSILINIP